MAWWIWVLAAFVLLALEFATTTLHVAFFAVGALAVAALQGLGVDLPLWGQLAVFTVVSLTAFFLIRPMIMRKLRLTEVKVVDSIVGEYAVAMVAIAPGGIGKADLRGASWNARNIGTVPISSGERCAVKSIEGLVLQIQGSAV